MVTRVKEKFLKVSVNFFPKVNEMNFGEKSALTIQKYNIYASNESIILLKYTKLIILFSIMEYSKVILLHLYYQKIDVNLCI